MSHFAQLVDLQAIQEVPSVPWLMLFIEHSQIPNPVTLKRYCSMRSVKLAEGRKKGASCDALSMVNSRGS